MKLHQDTASVFIPDGRPAPEAFGRITHLGIGAHQDDIEIMAFHGILQCYHKAKKCFGAVTCTDGRGSPRAGKYAALSDEEMRQLRRREQDHAAAIGGYGAVVQLDYPSSRVKDPQEERLIEDLETVLLASKPRVVYTHNLADRHETHAAVAMRAIQAIRRLPADDRPKTVYGCEVWRDLDWLTDADKVALDVGRRVPLAKKLIDVYDSQIEGGKNYRQATIGRRLVNATYFQSHETDVFKQLCYAMDLTPLILDDSLDPIDFVLGFLRRFHQSAESMLRKISISPGIADKKP
jgi:LmbE family N-acetylglucosaminyl deacetylase